MHTGMHLVLISSVKSRKSNGEFSSSWKCPTIDKVVCLDNFILTLVCLLPLFLAFTVIYLNFQPNVQLNFDKCDKVKYQNSTIQSYSLYEVKEYYNAIKLVFDLINGNLVVKNHARFSPEITRHLVNKTQALQEDFVQVSNLITELMKLRQKCVKETKISTEIFAALEIHNFIFVGALIVVCICVCIGLGIIWLNSKYRDLFYREYDLTKLIDYLGHGAISSFIASALVAAFFFVKKYSLENEFFQN